MRVRTRSIGIAAVISLISQVLIAEAPASGWPSVCKQSELLKALRIIDSACDSVRCDTAVLKRLDDSVDKPTLFATLRSRDLLPLHFFFKTGKSDLTSILRWDRAKAQLDSLKLLPDPDNAVIYIIGQASAPGTVEDNYTLSQNRMKTVMAYLEKTLKVNCFDIRGGWVGEEVFQLDRAEASRMGIESYEYESDEQILNQAVHIFVFPCAPLLPKRARVH